MNTDIRVEVGFFGHRKTRKLIAKFGLDAAWGLLQLWAFAARSRCSGYLIGMSNLDIAMEMHVDGKANADELVAYMKSEDCRWLDDTERGIYLHDWHIHNPWAAKAEDRSDQARLSRMALTHPDIYKSLSEKGINAISRVEYDRLTAPQRIVSVASTKRKPRVKTALSPAPAPDPAPDPDLKSKTEVGQVAPDRKKREACTSVFLYVYDDMYRQRFNGTRPPIVGGRDTPAVRRLLARGDPEYLGSQLTAYFSTTDQFVRNNAFDIPRFEKWLAARAVGGYGVVESKTGGGHGKPSTGTGIAPQPGEFNAVKPLLVVP